VYKSVSPLLFASKDRAVSGQDYNAQPLLYPGVLDAKIVGQEDLSPTDLRYMNLLRVSLVTTTVWDTLAFNTFKAWMQKIGMYSCRMYRQDPIARVIPVTATIGLKALADASTVVIAVEQVLTAHFVPRRGIIGFDIHENDIHTLIKTAHPDIDYVDLVLPAGDVISEVGKPVAVLTQGAGTLGARTYYYRMTALNALGETLPSDLFPIAISASTGVVLNWTAVPNATGYKIYGRTDSTGLALLLIATVGLVTTYTDNGSITPAGAMNALDTTGVHYPTLGTVSLSTVYSTRKEIS
jgi:hypothetical protein